MPLPYARKTCAECPWLRATPTERFPAERYRQLAGTMQDMAVRVFACHKTQEGREIVCAGAILRTHHSLTLRLQGLNPGLVQASGPLYDGYREMAVANGVDPDDPCLSGIRDPED